MIKSRELNSLFLPGRLSLLLIDLVVWITEFDLRVVGQTRRHDVQLQVLVVLHMETFSQYLKPFSILLCET